MKAATDNAEELSKSLSREANQLRQAQITQELSEIVVGTAALRLTGRAELNAATPAREPADRNVYQEEVTQPTMTAAVTTPTEGKAALDPGRVVRIIGPVVDVEFPGLDPRTVQRPARRGHAGGSSPRR